MAKIRADQLPNALKKNLFPVYLVTGDEPLQVQESCDAIRQSAKSQGFTERELFQTDSGFQWDQLHHASSSLSLFAEKKMIEIRVHNGKIDEKANKAIEEFCSNISEDILLLLVLPKIDKRAQSSRWFKAVEKVGASVAIWPITAQQLPKWLELRLRAANIHATNEALDMLAAKVEGNLLAAVQEVEKLKLVVQDGETLDGIKMARSVISSARYDVYGLVDKALTGACRQATETLQGLKSEATEPRIILWTLSREIHTLVTIKEMLAEGKSFDLAAKSNGVWDSRKNTIRHAIYRHEISSLQQLVRKIALGDQMIKGAVKGDIWNLLTDITLHLSGVETLTTKH